MLFKKYRIIKKWNEEVLIVTAWFTKLKQFYPLKISKYLDITSFASHSPTYKQQHQNPKQTNKKPTKQTKSTTKQTNKKPSDFKPSFIVCNHKQYM